MRRAIDTHLSLHFRDYRHHMHQHWYWVVQDHGEEATRQQPYDSITMDDWTAICRYYEDPTYQVTHLNFFLEFNDLIIYF